MGMIKKLDHSGDSALAVWDPADEISVQEARVMFDRLVADPMVVLSRCDDATQNTATKIREFDPEAEQIIGWSSCGWLRGTGLSPQVILVSLLKVAEAEVLLPGQSPRV